MPLLRGKQQRQATLPSHQIQPSPGENYLPPDLIGSSGTDDVPFRWDAVKPSSKPFPAVKITGKADTYTAQPVIAVLLLLLLAYIAKRVGRSSYQSCNPLRSCVAGSKADSAKGPRP